MNTRTKAKHPPIISNTMATIAFFIHVILSVINFNFSALVNGIPLHQSNVSILIFVVIQPALVACLIAPVMSVVRHSDYFTEFRNILFITVGLYVVYALADMAGLLG